MYKEYYHPNPDVLLYGWRVYSFDHAYQADEFAEMFNGIARSGKDSIGKWTVLL